MNVWPVVYLIYHFIYITYVACWAGTDDTIATYVQYYEHCPPSKDCILIFRYIGVRAKINPEP